MNTYVALLRAVNVGGTGKLPMAELRKMCERCGFEAVRTYIASGNVVFRSGRDPAGCRAGLEAELKRYAGRPVDVLLRSGTEMAGLVERDPFAGRPGNRVTVHFLDGPAPADLDAVTKGADDELLEAGEREVFVFYPDGMGRSKLSLDLGTSTARNMNTVTRLAELAATT